MTYILEFLSSKMKTPVAYSAFETSWLHYVSLVLMILSIMIVYRLFKQKDMVKIKKTILIIGIVMVLFEIYKQIIFTYESGSYQWYAFPFQFCSVPMYLYILLGLIRNEKISKHLISFLATYGTFAGLAVMLYPASVFVDTIGINIQTMLHHGMMAVVGISLLFTVVPIGIKTLFRGMVTFIVLVTFAYLLNTISNIILPNITFNMFFINPLYGTEIPVLSLIEPNVPHFIFLIVYILGFSLMAQLMILFAGGIRLHIMKDPLLTHSI